MNLRAILASILFSSSALAADLPPVPAESIAVKKELLFSEDFSGPELAPPWHKVIATFGLEKSALKGTQVRDKSIPAADGKPAVSAHAAIQGLELPTKDSVIEVKIRFEGATLIDVEFDDRKYEGSHYGHLCRAQVRLTGVTIVDERDGRMRNDIVAMSQDPAKKEERAKLLVGREVTYPTSLEAGRWYDLMVETVGDTMRVTIDGKPAAVLTSSGIGHATKSKIEFGVAGRDGYLDDLKVWNAAPAKR